MIAQLGVSTVCNHGSVSRFETVPGRLWKIGGRPMVTAIDKMFAV